MLEIEQMVLGVQRRFAEDLGWSLSPPMSFSLDTYIADLERAEHAYKSQFGPLAVLTTEKWRLMERFFDTVVSKSREIFSTAERDTEAWVKSLLPPIETQVREQRSQLQKARRVGVQDPRCAGIAGRAHCRARRRARRRAKQARHAEAADRSHSGSRRACAG